MLIGAPSCVCCSSMCEMKMKGGVGSVRAVLVHTRRQTRPSPWRLRPAHEHIRKHDCYASLPCGFKVTDERQT